MDKEQIIQMAREAGLASFGGWTEQNIENFAYAVRAATKEEDAKICESESLTYTIGSDEECGWEMAIEECASSIRASK